MADGETIRFDDGAAYEDFMGVWSRAVGTIFLEWLQPPPQASWIDVGCGNGAFTQLIVDRCRPSAVQGIDPSPEQIAFARTRGAAPASFDEGDAMALPAPTDSLDVAVSALVIFFMPDPQQGVREMARVVRAGGLVASYAWDWDGGGFPYVPVQDVLRDYGRPPLAPPHPEAADLGELERLWTAAGLVDVATREITVTRPFPSFDAFWQTATRAGGIKPVLAALGPDDQAVLKQRVAERMGSDGGAIAPSARAHAVMGRVG